MKTILVKENLVFLFKHISVLLPYEKEDINLNGLLKTSRKTMTSKINNAVKSRYLSDDEDKYLVSKITVDSQNPEGLLYCYTSISRLLHDSFTEMNINSMLGGESINWILSTGDLKDDSPSLSIKLKPMGEANIIVIGIPFNRINFGSYYYQQVDICKLIMLSYISLYLKIDYQSNYLVVTTIAFDN